MASHGLSLVCAHGERVSELSCVFSYKDIILLDQASTLMTSFSLHYFLWSPICKYRHIWWIKVSTYILGAHTQSITVLKFLNILYTELESYSMFSFRTCFLKNVIFLVPTDLQQQQQKSTRTLLHPSSLQISAPQRQSLSNFLNLSYGTTYIFLDNLFMLLFLDF